VLRRTLTAAALVLAAGVALTGCAVHDSTGRLTVHLSADAAAGRNYSVRVYDAQAQRVEQQYVFAGQSITFAGVPLGKVTVRATGYCPERTTVGYKSAASVTLSTAGC
jgi:hypothetical protein